MVLGVGGQCIPPSVDSDGGAPGDVVVELDVRLLGQVELHVPVAVRVDGLGQLLSQLDLREGRAIRRETSGWERAGACCRENIRLLGGLS